MKNKMLLLLAGLFLLSSALIAKEEKPDMSVAVSLGKTFSWVAKESFPAVVVIENLQVPNGLGQNRLPPELEFFFGRPNRPQPKARGEAVTVGRGSGFFLRADGYIVTNQHVVKDAKFLRVKLKDGTVFDNQKEKDAVVVVGEDKSSDLAILKIKGSGYPILSFANSDQVEIGEWAIAIGAPFNWDYTLTVGVVSQVGRHNVFSRDRIVEDYIQTDASINPGNSGGPLLNIKGEVIGVNNFIATGGGGANSAGIGFAISSNLVKKVADELIDNGSVKRPWLGISMADLSKEDRKNFKITEGVLVRGVLSGEPAEKGGMQPGDIILSVGNKKCMTAYDVQASVLQYKPGDEIPLVLKRDGNEIPVKITASLRGDGNETAKEDGDKTNRLGLSLRDQNGAVVVSAVEEDSEAERRNLKAGMKVLSLNRTDVKSVAEFNKVLESSSGNSVMLKLEANGRVFIEFLPLN